MMTIHRPRASSGGMVRLVRGILPTINKSSNSSLSKNIAARAAKITKVNTTDLFMCFTVATGGGECNHKRKRS